MSTITRRSVRRNNHAKKFEGLPHLGAFMVFLANRVKDFGTNGRLAGKRVFVGQMGNGAFLSATFAHPTKKSNRGSRMATLSWRVPEAK